MRTGPGPGDDERGGYPPAVAGAIFVVAGSSRGQQGPVAALLSTAGWASAAGRVLGRAWVVTPAGVVDPTEARRAGSDPGLRSSEGATLRRRVPAPLKTLAKDLRSWRRASRFQVDEAGPWAGTHIDFVWQRHELFQTAGLRLAERLGVPSVLFVPATTVWEAERWGSTRPGWGRWAERWGEAPALRAADVVACGTEAVAEQVQRLGVDVERITLTPSGVDLDLFDPAVDGGAVRARHGIGDEFVVGWVGSFRRFHALEQAVEAAADVPGMRLLLVGDGPERPRIEALARARGVATTSTGTVPQEDLPAHLAAMDAAVVLAGSEDAFHYSPLKLAEYLAAGLPVVAPAVGQLVERLSDGIDALLVPPHDTQALARSLRLLRDDPTLRRRIGQAARAAAVDRWSWDRQVTGVAEAARRSTARAADG